MIFLSQLFISLSYGFDSDEILKIYNTNTAAISHIYSGVTMSGDTRAVTQSVSPLIKRNLMY